MRGIKTGLHGGLIRLLAEVGEEVADLLLAGIKDVPGGCLVDSVGDLLTETLEALAELFAQGIGGKLRLGVHAGLRRQKGWSSNSGRHGQAKLPLQSG